VENGIDINIKDKYGKTALDLAKKDKFEEIILKYRCLQNLIISLYKSCYGHELIVKYIDLYPGAYGTRETLEKEITIQPTHLLISSLIRGDTIDNYTLSDVKGISVNVNLKEGKYAVKNAPLANSFDAIIYHPGRSEILPPNIELLQFKSSEHIRIGSCPKSSITIDDIYTEIKKINNRTTFYEGILKTIIIVTNKPLEYYDLVNGTCTKFTNHGYNLPHGVIVICYENILECSPFFHQF